MNKTEINPNLSNVTEVNNHSIETQVNNILGDVVILEKGKLIADKYEIEYKLDFKTGEADLYLCNYQDEKYVAKIYRRDIAVKENVILALKELNSDYVAKLYEYGTIDGKQFEITRYYSKGNLDGKTFTFNKLKSEIIPCINEGLRVLHDAGIIHKDIKPTNLMVDDDGTIDIIDFGISSSTNNGSTVIVTQTGKTPEYSAPETFRELFLSESDYYSFGITLYELFTGTTPYRSMTNDEKEMYITIQKIPKPQNMPDELYELILGLTYNDLTNRKDKSNPNRRFTYEEVDAWLKGKKLTLPGTGTAKPTEIQMPAYTFLGKKYNDLSELCIALAINWEDGKKQLYRGLLSGFLKSFDPELAGFCLDAEDEGSKAGFEDVEFCKLLYKLCPNMDMLYWKEHKFKNIEQFGADVLDCLRKNNQQINPVHKEILKVSLISQYMKLTSQDTNLVTAISSLEKLLKDKNNSTRDMEQIYFLIGYLLSNDKEFHFNGNKFKNISDLSEYLKDILGKSYQDFEKCCHQLIDEDNSLLPQFESWLIAHGKRDEISNWKRNLKQ